ncbi:ankyrin repeat [Fusarium subglutinans]|uniref:Ankyrin repeat n=1 Tax=Gibberella subglutinans TaxID=42677 RepID=A0A8H5QGC8_GIBSU|nr:ankyrin repeat [Fusarium subglutinans]KAF5613568.1 ankyrin repeat [Fusarium subglutinans]
MASRNDYIVGWVCALPLVATAAEAMLDSVHPDGPLDLDITDDIKFVFGRLNGYDIVLAYPSPTNQGNGSAVEIVEQVRLAFRSIRFILLIGLGGGVPHTKENISPGDVVVGRPEPGRSGLVLYEGGQVHWNSDDAGNVRSRDSSDKPSSSLLTATRKVEMNSILGNSHMRTYMSTIIDKQPTIFAPPELEKGSTAGANDGDRDVKSSGDRGEGNGRHTHSWQASTDRLPKVHYGLVASCQHQLRDSKTRDSLAADHGILCFETEAFGLPDNGRIQVIRGICGYSDSSFNDGEWKGYAAAAAAAYARELLMSMPTVAKPVAREIETRAAASTVLDALLLTRPEVDRSSLIALKGRRADGTCEWLTRHANYQRWAAGDSPPLLWVSGGPGKGKTMLAIYVTELLQPEQDSTKGVLLYYFCSNRDKNRNSAVTIMRGIIHQWITAEPHLAQHVKSYFDGSETIKYTISNFVTLWRVFLSLLRETTSSTITCVLDGLDECEKGSLQQLLDALRKYLSQNARDKESKLRLILLSRSQPVLLESKLGQFSRVRLDESDMEVAKDVERYIASKVSELALDQTLTEDQLSQVRQALVDGADGTFLWVGFVADELQGRSWQKIQDILHRMPKGLGGVYQRLLLQVEDKERLIPILQWLVLAARPLAIDELCIAAKIAPSVDRNAVEATRDRLNSCGLLVKVDGDVANLVHESAKEFFQSDQVDELEEIRMFRMGPATHRALMDACLSLIENSHASPGGISEQSLTKPLLAYACLYWPYHLQRAQELVGDRSMFTRSFFKPETPIREDWWKFYWDKEQYGGAPPSFSLLHLSSYLDIPAWTRVLLEQDAAKHSSRHRLVARKDNYGRTPLFWAATRGHKDIVELLLKHGAPVGSKDRSNMTPLHIAVTGGHKEVVALLLEHSAPIEAKASYGDTPLIRAIQANSKEIVQLLLEHGASIAELPIVGTNQRNQQSMTIEERAEQLLGLQEQLFAARYEESSRLVGLTIKTLTLSFQFQPIAKLFKFYLEHSSIGRWEVMHVLQDLVRNNKIARLRNWAQAYIDFGIQLVQAEDAKNLAIMTDLSVQVFRVVSTGDLEALLVIGVLVGSSVILAAAEKGWWPGVDISARTFAQFAALAYHRDRGEFLHYGVREFLVEFDGCIRGGRRSESAARTVVLFSTHFAIIDTKETRPIDYFATIIAEYYEGYVGTADEERLFSDATQACADELEIISKTRDSHKLLLFATAILQFIERCSKDIAKDHFLSMIPASCMILCQRDHKLHAWLVAKAIPETMSVSISQLPEMAQRRAFKALVECIIIGKQYGLSDPVDLQQRLRQTPNISHYVSETLEEILF